MIQVVSLEQTCTVCNVNAVTQYGGPQNTFIAPGDLEVLSFMDHEYNDELQLSLSKTEVCTLAKYPRPGAWLAMGFQSIWRHLVAAESFDVFDGHAWLVGHV